MSTTTNIEYKKISEVTQLTDIDEDNRDSVSFLGILKNNSDSYVNRQITYSAIYKNISADTYKEANEYSTAYCNRLSNNTMLSIDNARGYSLGLYSILEKGINESVDFLSDNIDYLSNVIKIGHTTLSNEIIKSAALSIEKLSTALSNDIFNLSTSLSDVVKLSVGILDTAIDSRIKISCENLSNNLPIASRSMLGAIKIGYEYAQAIPDIYPLSVNGLSQAIISIHIPEGSIQEVTHEEVRVISDYVKTISDDIYPVDSGTTILGRIAKLENSSSLSQETKINLICSDLSVLSSTYVPAVYMMPVGEELVQDTTKTTDISNPINVASSFCVFMPKYTSNSIIYSDKQNVLSINASNKTIYGLYTATDLSVKYATSSGASGSAESARRLTIGRTITILDSDGTNKGTASTSFDGSSDLTVSLPSTIKASIAGNATTATTFLTSRTITILDNDGTNKGDAQSFNGSADISLKLPSTIKTNITGNVTGDVIGNATTATTATTASGLNNNSTIAIGEKKYIITTRTIEDTHGNTLTVLCLGTEIT